MNTGLFTLVNSWADENVFTRYLSIFAADYLLWIMAASLVVPLIITRRSDIRFIGGGLLSSLLGWLAATIGKSLVLSPRPYASSGTFANLLVEPLTATSLHAFPSGHTTTAFALAIFVILVNRKWGSVLLIAACLVGIGRIAVGVHWPNDIVGGALLSSLIGCIVWFVLYRTTWLTRSWR